jgi:hypothetical protein
MVDKQPSAETEFNACAPVKEPLTTGEATGRNLKKVGGVMATAGYLENPRGVSRGRGRDRHRLRGRACRLRAIILRAPAEGVSGEGRYHQYQYYGCVSHSARGRRDIAGQPSVHGEGPSDPQSSQEPGLTPHRRCGMGFEPILRAGNRKAFVAGDSFSRVSAQPYRQARAGIDRRQLYRASPQPT